jgi:hypothetical protein
VNCRDGPEMMRSVLGSNVLIGITKVNAGDFFDLHIRNVPRSPRARVGTGLSNTPGEPLATSLAIITAPWTPGRPPLDGSAQSATRWIICAIPRARRGYPRLVMFDARCQAPCIVHGGSSHSRYGERTAGKRDRQIGELREPKIIYGTMLLLPLCFHDGRPWKQLPRCPGLSKRFQWCAGRSAGI